jgi:rare lipoprotein A
LIGAARTMRSPAVAGLMTVAALLSGCGSNAVRPAQAHHHEHESGGDGGSSSLPPLVDKNAQDGFPAKSDIPADVASIPDAVPKPEPLSALGNPDSYEVYGDHYDVLKNGHGFKERGMASWYGKKFQGKRTSSGEAYDMFKMTAAHKTLPIPCYVRVTSLETGRSVVVRVNDRGPFHSGRIIDVSYAAAVKLDILGRGSIPVEIAALDPNAPTPATQYAAVPPPAPAPRPPQPAAVARAVPTDTIAPPPPPPLPAPVPAAVPALAAVAVQAPPAATPPQLALAPSLAVPPPAAAAGHYLQTGLFTDPVNAVSMRDHLNDLGFTNVELKNDVRNGANVSRVLIGPFGDDDTLAAVRKRLLDLQMPAMPVVE